MGEKAPGSGDLGRQVEGIVRLSIVPRSRSRVGRCVTFESEKRKFLSVSDTVLSAVVAFAVVRCIWRFSFYLDDVTKQRKSKARP